MILAKSARPRQRFTAFLALAGNKCLAGFPLGIQGIEGLLQAFLG
jgi:hypothetical protein